MASALPSNLDLGNSSPPTGFSGHGTEPTNPTNTLDATTPCRNFNCCSLLDPTWRYDDSSPSTGQPATPAPLDDDADLDVNLSTLWTSFEESCRIPEGRTTRTPRTIDSYKSNRAIVTFNADNIGPDQLLDAVDQSKVFGRKPWGITVNTRTGEIYVTDRIYHNILIFGPDGTYQGKIGEYGTAPGCLYRPAGIAFDAANNRIIVADKDNHRIQAFDATTRSFVFTFGSHGTQNGEFQHPWGVAVSPEGSHIAVVDPRNHRIQIFNSDGTFARAYFTSAMQRQAAMPIYDYLRGVTFDNTGKLLYITDYNLHRIYRLDLDQGQFSTVVDSDRSVLYNSELQRPSGLDVDAAGNILVTDHRHNAIKIFSPKGRFIGKVTSIGHLPIQHPLDLCVMPSGQVAVMDRFGRTRIF